MGWAKYHEDDLKIFDERMYYRNASMLPSVQSSYYGVKSKTESKTLCPFCKSGFINEKKLIDHIVASHGGVHEFVYLNNRRIKASEETVKQVFSLILYCFRDAPKEIQLKDGMGEEYSFWTQVGKYEYDIQSILQARPYSEIHICNIDIPVCIKQQLDINIVSMDKIIAGKYLSYLFDEQVSEELLSPKECLIYLKMLIYEGSETESFIERIGYMNLDKTRDLEELYYYHFLKTGSMKGIENKLSGSISKALGAILNGNYSEAAVILDSSIDDRNDRYGCMIIVSLLRNDKLGVDYLIKKYTPYGYIGTLEQVLYYFSMYEKEDPKILVHEINELKLFNQYPLIRALAELTDALNQQLNLSYESYSLLRELTPLAAIYYCYGLDNAAVKEKVLKSMVKIHKNSALIKEYAFQNEYSWIKRKISMADGELYRKAVIRRNKELGNIFSKQFIEEFPFDDQIQITPLGGEHEIGASCFVISFKGYNIMLDCGINPHKYGDSAYPGLDFWRSDIDTIVVSHAHIDHSGGVPKAHAMWPNASIITTSATKVLLKYLYSDMAKVKNGISDEFEIENITLEKDVMLDTFNSMSTVDYGKWIYLSRDIQIRLHPAGHIVGAAMIEMNVDGKTILYTGDFCNYSQALAGSYKLGALPQNVDYLISESTYMKKSKVDWKRQCDELKAEIIQGVKRNHGILLPAASVGRSQELVCIVGEMKLLGEIPEKTPLYLAGMAIPATTQIIPFMNDRYAGIVGLFEEFDGILYPQENAIVIASSGTMSKGSASYKIAKFWENQCVKFKIIANGFLEEDTETDWRYVDKNNIVRRMSLSMHADLRGIIELIEYVSPKVISFVHRGNESEVDFKSLISSVMKIFSNDIVYRELYSNRSERIFDMYESFMEGAEE